MFLLNSKDRDGYKYHGPVFDPHIGLLAHAGPIFDVEGGVKGHFIAGKMYDPELRVTNNFSNEQPVRGYLCLALVSSIGPYAKFNFDMSPSTTSNWKDGPVEASLGFTVGFTLKTQRTPKTGKTVNTYFPDYDKMKEQQEEMMKELKE
jgi:hypothetical protein